MQKLLCALALISSSALAAEPTPLNEPGALLREGTWNGDVGSYGVPRALAETKPAQWPIDGWYRLRLQATGVQSERVATPRQGGLPEFMRSIANQLESTETQTEPAPYDAVPDDIFYLRVPGVRFREGQIGAYVFKNGSSSLRPKLDHRYELKLGEQAFAFVVMNGYRNSAGVAYGEGARYAIEYDGRTYEYELGGFGWDSSIAAIADLDGDGKPDFVIRIGGNNSGGEAVLLSSQARPGRNPATASLWATGC